jgi:type II secretory ATPase GspE/PulE/Tfp pilus assembly ATPase PilB-like protein
MFLSFFRRSSPNVSSSAFSEINDLRDLTGPTVGKTPSSEGGFPQPRLLGPQDRITIPSDIDDGVVVVVTGKQVSIYYAQGTEKLGGFRSLVASFRRRSQDFPEVLQKPVQPDELTAYRRQYETGVDVHVKSQLYVADQLRRANAQGVSDIQLRSYDTNGGLIYRIDGDYTDVVEALSSKQVEEFASTLFNMADTTSKSGIYAPTIDGSASIVKNLKNFGLDDILSTVRLQFIPAHLGPECAIRILPKGQTARHLTELGLLPDQIEQLREITEHHGGCGFFSGPTGSGKTTTDAAVQNDYFDRHPHKRGIQLADPVEIQLHRNVTQWLIGNLTEDELAKRLPELIAKALRSDPQFMSVQECRHAATARALIRAGITGTVAFTTVHSNNALGILERLIEWDISHHSLRNPDTIIGLVAVRLCKKLCSCKIPLAQALADNTTHTVELRRAVNQFRAVALEIHDRTGDPVPNFDRMFARKHDGCPDCSGGERVNRRSFGHLGRFQIAEIVRPDEELLDHMVNARFAEAKTHLRQHLKVRSLHGEMLHRMQLGDVCPLDAKDALGLLRQNSEQSSPALMLSAAE